MAEIFDSGRRKEMAIGTVINKMRVTDMNEKHIVLRPIQGEIRICQPEMVKIEGGTFRMGSTRFRNAQPARQVTLKDFAIGKYPVTNNDYLMFLQVMEKQIPEKLTDQDLSMHPVVNISWNDAVEYYGFISRITGRKFGLPTEAQWEYAASGTEGRQYPWGNESHEGRVNFNSRGTTPVDKFPSGATPSGIYDMSGNVWEWVHDWFVWGYNPKDLSDPKRPDIDACKVIRGSSWKNNVSHSLMTAFRSSFSPSKKDSDVGFRLVEDLG